MIFIIIRRCSWFCDDIDEFGSLMMIFTMNVLRTLYGDSVMIDYDFYYNLNDCTNNFHQQVKRKKEIRLNAL